MEFDTFTTRISAVFIRLSSIYLGFLRSLSTRVQTHSYRGIKFWCCGCVDEINFYGRTVFD